MRILSSPPAPLTPSYSSGSSAESALALLGPSTAMAQLWLQIRRLAPYARTILLTGPPDTGQTAVARLLLELSSSPTRPFLELQPSEAQDELVRGTPFASVPAEALLYLPEIERLSGKAQQGLLRLLHQRRSRGLILVTSTSADLRTLVSLGHFSEALFDVLSPIRISLPPLRQRKEDIPMLLSQTLALLCEPLQRTAPSLSDEFLRAVLDHAWPGNLRELYSVAAQLLQQTSTSQPLQPSDLRLALAAISAPRPAAAHVRMVPLDTVVREHIQAVLRACRGNKLRAAETLGISRSTLYRMLETTQPAHPLQMAS